MNKYQNRTNIRNVRHIWFMRPTFTQIGWLLSHSRRPSAAIAQKVPKVKNLDQYLFKTPKIIKIGSIAQKLEHFKKPAFFPGKKCRFTDRLGNHPLRVLLSLYEFRMWHVWSLIISPTVTKVVLRNFHLKVSKSMKMSEKMPQNVWNQTNPCATVSINLWIAKLKSRTRIHNP